VVLPAGIVTVAGNTTAEEGFAERLTTESTLAGALS
jgi:hypothetical protein